LEQRHAELMKLHTIERPYLPYEPYGPTLVEELWMESIEKAMVYLNDKALVNRIAPVIAGYFGNPWTCSFDDYSKILLKEANDPALYEKLLRKIETQPYEYSYNTIIEFLLSLNINEYKQRLKLRLLELKKTTKSDNLYRYQLMIEESE